MAVGNSVNDEIREQQKKVFKEQGFKGKLEYFIYYYLLTFKFALQYRI